MCQRKATWVTSVSLVHGRRFTVDRETRPVDRKLSKVDCPLMFKILDRYLVREIVLPFALALVVFTFVLEIPPILQQAESLIARGVEWSIVIRVLLTLLPQ